MDRGIVAEYVGEGWIDIGKKREWETEMARGSCVNL